MNVRRWLSEPAVLAALFVLYIAARVVFLARGQVFTSYDTFSFAYRDDEFFNRGPLVSFVGDAPRLWGVPLAYAPFGDDGARAAFQWAVGTVAWGALAWAISRYLKSAPVRVAAFAAILGLGLLGTVVSWDFAILSESLSISLGVLTLALFLQWRRTGSVKVLIAMTVIAVWWTFTRPDIMLLSAFFVLALGLIAWRQRKKAAAVAAAAIAAGIVWCLAIVPATNVAFTEYSGTTLAENPLPAHEELFVYRLRIHVFADPELKKTFETKLGMPSCPGADRVAERSSWDTVDFTREYVRCPELAAWGRENYGRFWTGQAEADPGQFAGLFWRLSSESFGGESYASVPQVVPAIVERAVFPSRRHGLPVVLVGLGVALALALISSAYRSQRTLFTTAVVIAIASLGSVAASTWLAAGEYRRFGIQETIAIRVSMIILVVCAIDAWLTRRRDRASE